MKITKIEPILSGNRHLFVKVHTDEGIVGLGESGLWAMREGVVGTLKCLEPVLVGEDVNRINFINERLYEEHQFKGMNIQSAISAIDLALWDIKGKALGVPVYDLFGGKYRDKIRVWRHITPSNDNELFRALLLEAKEEGFTAVRINPCRDMEGFASSKRLATMYQRIAFAREVLGDEIDIAIEIHRELNGDESLMLCKMLESLNILFFEDPIRSESIEPLKEFTAKTVVPIAAGERCISIQEFEMMLNAGMRIARPDVCTLGGFTGSMKVCALAEAHHAYIVPHVPVSVINIAASLHMAAAIPNFLIMETFPPKTFQQALDCMGDYKFKLKDGYMEIPDGPGWGVDLADDIEQKNPYVTIPWKLDQYHCYGGADTTNQTQKKNS